MSILYSVFGPFLLWPVEYFLPYPYVIEELFKCVVVWFGEKNALIYLLSGFAFALTETILYTLNANTAGSIGYLIIRFATTGVLHSATFLIIYATYKRSKKLIPVGFLVSMTLHYLYNLYI
jgi:RsiW-degrading membrane proteinase PrsW (M82 family)